MTEWQPIETAPKDATPVLIGSPAGVGEAWCSPSDLKWRWPDGELVLMNPEGWMPLPEWSLMQRCEMCGESRTGRDHSACDKLPFHGAE